MSLTYMKMSDNNLRTTKDLVNILPHRDGFVKDENTLNAFIFFPKYNELSIVSSSSHGDSNKTAAVMMEFCGEYSRSSGRIIQFGVVDVERDIKGVDQVPLPRFCGYSTARI